MHDVNCHSLELVPMGFLIVQNPLSLVSIQQRSRYLKVTYISLDDP
jgi:hypothetical protein